MVSSANFPVGQISFSISFLSFLSTLRMRVFLQSNGADTEPRMAGQWTNIHGVGAFRRASSNTKTRDVRRSATVEQSTRLRFVIATDFSFFLPRRDN